MGKRGQNVWTAGNDEEALSRGVFNAYTRKNLRYSQVRSLSGSPRTFVGLCPMHSVRYAHKKMPPILLLLGRAS
jgi:hypothetical protein